MGEQILLEGSGDSRAVQIKVWFLAHPLNEQSPSFALPLEFGTTSGHLKGGNFAGFPCKRHQQSNLVFFPTCFASRGSGVRIPSRPPTICLQFQSFTTVPWRSLFLSRGKRSKNVVVFVSPD